MKPGQWAKFSHEHGGQYFASISRGKNLTSPDKIRSTWSTSRKVYNYKHLSSGVQCIPRRQQRDGAHPSGLCGIMDKLTTMEAHPPPVRRGGTRAGPSTTAPPPGKMWKSLTETVKKEFLPALLTFQLLSSDAILNGYAFFHIFLHDL